LRSQPNNRIVGRAKQPNGSVPSCVDDRRLVFFEGIFLTGCQKQGKHRKQQGNSGRGYKQVFTSEYNYFIIKQKDALSNLAATDCTETKRADCQKIGNA
jgi:hypothetical protein